VNKKKQKNFDSFFARPDSDLSAFDHRDAIVKSPWPKSQKFFGSFFQKRTAYFIYAALF